MSKRPSFAQACATFTMRFTMEHVPTWAKKSHKHTNGPYAGKVLYYAPQFATDREWYDHTQFNGETELADASHCFTTGQTWPLGQWLKAPYVKGQTPHKLSSEEAARANYQTLTAQHIEEYKAAYAAANNGETVDVKVLPLGWVEITRQGERPHKSRLSAMRGATVKLRKRFAINCKPETCTEAGAAA